MLILRVKIILLSALAVILSCAFVLYKADLYNKERDLKLFKNQIQSTAKAAFDFAAISGDGVNSHTYDIINSARTQKEIRDLWVSRSDEFSASLGKKKSEYRDQTERNVYISRQPSEEGAKQVEGTNDNEVRVSFPIKAEKQCLACHPMIREDSVIGAVNATILLKDNIYDIIFSSEIEFLIFIVAASFISMMILMFSVKGFSKTSISIQDAMTNAINGDFSRRVKSGMIGTDKLAKLTNKLLDSLDRNLIAIDNKIAKIFIYNKTLYSKNPLMRLSEVINEVVALYSFKNKIDSMKKTNDIYKEIQIIIQKYIKYKSLMFVELVNGEVVSGYKVENETTTKVVAGEINSIEKRLTRDDRNVLYSDEKGSIFVSTSRGGLNVIDLKFVITNKLTTYYSIALESKKELAEKEKSITRIYNYMREARHIINNKMLLRQIEENAFTDPLTGAYNRFFLDRHSAYLKDKLDKRVSSFGVLMLDIDHFKNINDTYGHAIGDAGIVLLVETIRQVIRPIDKLVRYGGEEFVVILDNADKEEAERVAEKICAAFAMAKKCSRGELTFSKSVSIGVSAMPEFSKDIWECINQADTALYEAKEGGRNRVVAYSYALQARADAKNAEKEKAEKKNAKPNTESVIDLAINANSGKKGSKSGVDSGVDLGLDSSADSGVGNAVGEEPLPEDDDFEASLRLNNQV